MSLEENKAIVRKFVEIAFSKQNWDRLDDLVAPDYVDPDTLVYLYFMAFFA